MILESKQHPLLTRYKSRLQRFMAATYVKPVGLGLILILFVLSSKYMSLQIILQGCLIVLGLLAVVCKVPSGRILRLAFATIVLIPCSNIMGAAEVANVATIYAFLILCTGVLSAIHEEIRLGHRRAAKKSAKA